MRRLSLSACYVLSFLAAVLGLPAWAQTGAGPGASLTLYEGPDRLQRIVAAAQKEGSLTLYTSIKLVDPAVMLDERDKWTKAYEAIFIKRAAM